MSRARLALWAYGLMLRLAVPAYGLKLWWRSRREPAYAQHAPQRLGFGPAWDAEGRLLHGAEAGRGRVWVHAVSLGETRAAAPLLAALRRQRPGLRLLLTCSTATGLQAGRALLQPGDAQTWLPFDTPGAVARFLGRHRPAVGVILETEIWPQLMAAAQRQRVPLVLANARLSERSLRKGQRLRALMAPAVARFARVLAQTPADAARLLAGGARPEAVQVMGNLKFDLAPDPARLQQGRAWRQAWQDAAPPERRRIVLAASWREGEDEPLLRAWKALPAPRPLLWIVPRHPQRFDAVAQAVTAAGLRLARRSAWGDPLPPDALAADVWLGDSLGEMPAYYAAADVALLGGSFAPLGGQNLIEAAACGCPVIAGPHTFNFEQAAEEAQAAGAARRAPDLPTAVGWAVHDPLDASQAAAARAFAAAHRGAADRMAGEVLRLLDGA